MNRKIWNDLINIQEPEYLGHLGIPIMTDKTQLGRGCSKLKNHNQTEHP